MTESSDGETPGGTPVGSSHERETTSEEAVSTGVVIAVSEVLGTTADDLRPIGEVLDADALDSLVAGDGETDVSVRFQYERCSVVVTGDSITVEPPHHTLS
ncbi:HalOD1 output domain-containing protein [Halobaculum sp. MBLA0147]|uniref:HalOD1 output domain-containing protein n=1 Tax=Halobaculum sp. MBLA0147 TaxID=3079934 RepID=UPI00352573AD